MCIRDSTTTWIHQPKRLERLLRYTIITPSLLRPTLKRTCNSIDAQTNRSWQHVIVADCSVEDYANKRDLIPHDPRRLLMFCGTRHNDFGNTCRYNAWE